MLHAPSSSHQQDFTISIELWHVLLEDFMRKSRSRDFCTCTYAMWPGLVLAVCVIALLHGRHVGMLSIEKEIGNTVDGPKRCVQDQKQKPDADFVPNLVNTVCFVVNFIIQLSTFACNYQGAPFNTPIKQTKGFFNMLKYSYIFCLVIIYDVMGIGTAFSLVSNIAKLLFSSHCQLFVT